MAIPMLIAGAAVSAVGSIMGGNAEADAAEKQAMFQRQEADEVERRAALKAQGMEREDMQMEGEQGAAFSGGGVEMQGTPLAALEETHARVTRDIYEMQTEEAFRARQLRTGASLTEDQGSMMRDAGYLGAGGTILTSAGRAYVTSNPNTGNKVKLGGGQ